jgi:hypothetical protein
VVALLAAVVVLRLATLRPLVLLMTLPRSRRPPRPILRLRCNAVAL